MNDKHGEINGKPVQRGNVCVDQKGLLFVMQSPKSGPRMPAALITEWIGIGFNGQQVISQHFMYIAENLNEYMRQTYGEDFSKQLQDVTNGSPATSNEPSTEAVTISVPEHSS